MQLVLARLLGVLVRYQRALPDALADGNVDPAKLMPAEPLALPATLQWLHVTLQQTSAGRAASDTSSVQLSRYNTACDLGIPTQATLPCF